MKFKVNWDDPKHLKDIAHELLRDVEDAGADYVAALATGNGNSEVKACHYNDASDKLHKFIDLLLTKIER